MLGRGEVVRYTKAKRVCIFSPLSGHEFFCGFHDKMRLEALVSLALPNRILTTIVHCIEINSLLILPCKSKQPSIHTP